MGSASSASDSDRFANLALKALGIAGLLGILVASLLGNRHPLEEGVPAPPIDEVRTLDGAKVSLNLKQGKPIVINFWGAWCPPCVAELPVFANAAKEYEGRVVFYGLSNNTTPEQARDLATRFGITYALGEASGSVERAYNVAAWPSTYIIDGQGMVRWSLRGQIDKHVLDEALAPLLQ